MSNIKLPTKTIYDAILIPGMRHSGASTIAQLMTEFGIYMGNNLLPPLAESSKDFYEDQTLAGINKKFLSHIVHDSEFGTIASNYVNAEQYADMFDSSTALDYLLKNNFFSQPFAFKDPQLCFTFSFWKQLLTANNKKIACIIPIRNPLEIAFSLQKSNNFSHKYCLSLWFLYMVSIISTIKDTPTCFIDHDDIINNLDFVIHKIGSFIETDPHTIDKSLRNFKIDFLENKLQNATYSNENFSSMRFDYPIIINFFKSLQRLAKQERVQCETIKHLHRRYSQYIFYTNLLDENCNKVCYQLFLDTGEGFSQEDSTVITLPIHQNKIEFKFPTCAPVKRLRLNIGDTPCIIQLKTASANYLNGLSGNLIPLEDNSLSKHNNTFCFANNDPQIVFKCEKIVYSVCFDLNFLKINEIKNILKEINYQLDKLKNDILHKTHIIDQTTKQLETAEKKILIISQQNDLFKTSNDVKDKKVLSLQSRLDLEILNLQRAIDKNKDFELKIFNTKRIIEKLSAKNTNLIKIQTLQHKTLTQTCKQLSFAHDELESVKTDMIALQIKHDAALRTCNELQNKFYDSHVSCHNLRIELEAACTQVTALQSSYCWLITSPLRLVCDILLFTYQKLFFLLPHKILYKLRYSKPGALVYKHCFPQFLKNHINKVWAINNGLVRFLSSNNSCEQITAFLNFKQDTIQTPYESWLCVNEFTFHRKIIVEQKILSCTYSPKISIILPTYNPNLVYLEQLINSIEEQIYQNWELCIADDCSTNNETVAYLKAKAQNNSRIKLILRNTNGHISNASNSAAELATGEFITFVDQDDLVEQNALAEIILLLNNNQNLDVIYTDCDKIAENGVRYDPMFKPAWSPELLLSYMYIGHLFCLRKTFFEKVGGLRNECIGSQDYDLALRVSCYTQNFGHVPKILYHWRAVDGSTAKTGNNKEYSYVSGIKAVQDHIAHYALNAIVFRPDWAIKGGVGSYSIKFQDVGPTVAIIIPTKNHFETLTNCLASLKKTTYENYKIYIIDNDSNEQNILEFFRKTQYEVLKIHSQNNQFNYSYINNEAVSNITEDYILLLNNDTEIINPEWLSQMVGYAKIPGVGAVGAKLFFSDNTVQHAGVVHGTSRKFFPSPAFKHLHPDAGYGYLSLATVSRNCSAVTAACMLTSRMLYQKLGGLNEIDFAVAYNDVDYCYRLRKHGYRIVYAPEAKLYHHEGKTRGTGMGNDSIHEEAAFVSKYSHEKEPYLNPNLFGNMFEIKSRTLPETIPTPYITVLLVSHNLNFEGAPLCMLEMAKSIHKTKKIKFTVISLQDGALRCEYEASGIAVEILKDFNLLQAESEDDYNKRIAIIKQAIDKFSPDIIFGNTVISWWAIEIAAMLNIPSLWSIHESEIPFSHFSDYNQVVTKHAKACLAYPYQVVFVAEATKNVFLDLCTTNNFIVISNALNIERLKNTSNVVTKLEARKLLEIDSDKIVILSLGTICERKGQIDIINAIQFIDEKLLANVQIIMVGENESPYCKNIRQLSSRLPPNLKQILQIIPTTPETSKYYLASDIFICSSRIESYPKVIQEAMYFELGIITTPVFGIVEQVVSEQSALFYTPNNIEELASQVTRLLTNPDLRETLKRNAKAALATQITPDLLAQEYYDLFIEAYLSGKSR